MSLAACARLVERGDPDRFLAVMAAPPAARARLWPLYAFNLEVARIPWLTDQPLIVEMRLQFWRDTLQDPTPRAHEVAGPLRRLIDDTGLDCSLLLRLLEARSWDVGRAPHADAAAFARYIEDTSAGLMWAAAQALGAPAPAAPGLRALGWAAGLAQYLRAVPALRSHGRTPLVDDTQDAVKDLADQGLARLSFASAHRHAFGPGRAAALAGWLARPLLRRAAARPALVSAGGLEVAEFTRRGRLLWMAATGRF